MSLTPSTLSAALGTSVAIRRPLMIYGPPGVGKSDIVRAFAKSRGMELRDVRLSMMDPSDIRGLPMPNEARTQTRWIPPEFFPPTNTKKPGILFLDELTSAPPAVQATAYQLVLDRRVGEYELPASWHVIAAGNRTTDKGVAYQVPAPLRSRFIQVTLEASHKDLTAHAIASKWRPEIIAFLNFRPEATFAFDPSVNPLAYPCPRTWEMTNAILENNQLSAIDPLSLELIAGTIGQGTATEFAGFLNTVNELPTYEEIVKSPTTARLPEKPDARCAIATLLAVRATAKDMDKLVTYVSRIPAAEYHVMFLRSALLRDYSLSSSKALDAWLTKHGNLLV